MDIAQFIRVFQKNLILLITIPLLLAIVVFALTRNQDKIFESETIIYTGITTGYSIESTAQKPTDFFSTSAQFDNLINLINSRQTIVETALMLLAQNLSLESYNSQYISNENLDKLREFVPKRVRDMVVKNGKAGLEREKEEQIRNLEKEIRSLEKEINKKKTKAVQELVNQGEPTTVISQQGVSKDEDALLNSVQQTSNEAHFHIVQKGESILSIAQKYGVSISKLRELNDFSSQELKVGQKVILSGEGLDLYSSSSIAEKEVSLYEDEPSATASNDIINQPALEEEASTYTYKEERLDEDMMSLTIEKDPIIPNGILESDFMKTVQNFTNYYNSSDTNFIYGLLHYGSSKHYSIKAIKTLQIYRINNSDLVRLIYQSDDPGICQETLKIIAHVFVKNYKLLKENQTDLVVAYFKRQVDSADRQLQEAEDRLLKFNKKNNIINYAEQTKYIAAQKEDLDLYYQNEQVRMAKASASLKELETKLTRRDSIYLKSDIINQRRKQYADVTEKILINELAEDYDQRIGNEISMLRNKSDQLRDEIKLYVDQLYLYSHSTQGVPVNTLLNSWLENALSYEEAKASLVVLARRKMDFVRTYQRFAPLGAMLKRIEREITVAEQSYLELLRSLNLAKMRQQNLQMATNIKIVDPPYFPLQANPSKAKYLVLAAALIGFVLVAFIILVLEYFDASMKSPDRVVEHIGLKLAGAYPYVGSTSKLMDMVFISNRLIELIVQNLKMRLLHQTIYPAQKPYVVLMFSTQDGVGKSFVISRIANKLRTYGEKVLVLNYREEIDIDYSDNNLTINYEINDNFAEIKSLKELINSNVLRRENYSYDYIFIEIPSVIFHRYPIELMHQVDASILVVKASSHWNKADITALDIIKDLTKEPPMIILNEAEDYAIAEIISGVRVKKSSQTWYRIKRVLTLPFRLRIQVKENQVES
ncbi:MAG: LysM peptidoglycan-binding domain-containing protein [Bacteroidales bacterium]